MGMTEMVVELDWVVMMFLFAIVSFLALLTELWWKERIRAEEEDLRIWRDLFYALETDE
jgi:hypothetical protein